MYCTQCGRENPDNAQFCGSCGRPLLRPAAPAQPRTSGMAIASLVLGILGFLCGVPAIPGLILGIVGLRRINRSGGQLGGTGLAIAGIATSGAALLLMFLMLPAMLLPALARARMEARKTMGRANLHQIGLAIVMYRNANDEEFPPDYDSVIEQGYLDSRDVLFDPADPEAKELGPDAAPPSYEYVGPLPSFLAPNVIICYSRKGLYPDGRNVLRVDSSVEWVDEDALKGPEGWRPRYSLRASYRTVVEASGEDLTPERDAELRRFYEVED